MPRISLIILNWNGRAYLKGCLESLAAQTFRDFETILVDNGSTDGSAAYIREQYPWVTLVALSENTGFAGGNNRGLVECSGEYIVTLNNDTKVEPGFLAELVKAAERDVHIGMVAAKMLNYYEHGRIDSVGIAAAGNGLGISIGHGEVDKGQYDPPIKVFGPCGGAALYRRIMLDEIGFFDEDFFAYYEDLDLAWRSRMAGWECVTAPQAVVYHVHSATSGRLSPFTIYQLQRNKWFTVIKNWPIRLLLKRLPLLLAVDLAAFVLAFVKGQGGAAWRARRILLKSMGRLLEKRRKIQLTRRLTTREADDLVTSGGLWSIFRHRFATHPPPAARRT